MVSQQRGRMMKKVLIPTKLDKIAAQLLEAEHRYQVVQETGLSYEDAVRKHPDAFALIVRSGKVTAAVIDALPELKIIVRAGAGYNTIDTKHARRKGIDVMNTPGANANGVAEEVIAMILADARSIVAAHTSTRTGGWEKDKFMGRELAGKTVGIVGLGNIGRLVAHRLAGFDVTLLGYDPVISTERAAELNIELVSLDTLFTRSDFVTLHIPENEDTLRLVGDKLLTLMKNGATLVNCARAGIIDEEALRRIRKTKSIRFLNDVYPKDEAGEKSVADIADLMLPHIGANTHEANLNAARRAAEQLIDLDTKGITSFIVNRDVPHGLDEAYCELANLLARLGKCLLGKDARLRLIESSIYGALKPFGDWLVVPIVAGISDSFDMSMDHLSAINYLRELGIDYVRRDVDSNKKFEGSITVDMSAALPGGEVREVSVRGTVAESVIMVSRINEFDKLWFEPLGASVLFLYDDRPGVLGSIGAKLAAAGINIEDVRNPHDARTNRSLAIMKVNQPVPETLVREIQEDIRAIAAFSIRL